MDDLDRILRELHESMASWKYEGVEKGEDLAFTPLFKKHERSIPFRRTAAHDQCDASRRLRSLTARTWPPELAVWVSK